MITGRNTSHLFKRITVFLFVVSVVVPGWPSLSPGTVRRAIVADSGLENGARATSAFSEPAQIDDAVFRDGSAAEGDWPMAAANPARTSWTSEEVSGRLQPVWYRPIEPYIEQKIQIVAANGLLYISTTKGLYALDADSGDLAWVYPTELPLGHSPTIYENVAYVGGFDHMIHAINALTGEKIWTFEAGRGFQTNPLVIELGGSKYLFAGNRDGAMYAIEDLGASARLHWKYETDGPVLFSAAYKGGVLYFASNDSYAYALQAETGVLVWRSAKLPGAGFHSWWPVVYTDPATQSDVVVFSGSSNYRLFLEPGPLHDLQLLELDDLYVANNIPPGQPIAPIQADDSMDCTLILSYYEQKPWRRTSFVLDAASGAEVVVSYQRENGTSGTSYAPITWRGANGPGNRYPPVIGSDGIPYQPINYISDAYIARASIVGWELGATEVRVAGPAGAMDEPIAYAAGGNLIYWSQNSDRVAGAFDISKQLSEPDRNWTYFVYNLPSLIPNYNVLYQPGCVSYDQFSVYQGVGDSVNGIYGNHGDQNAPIPYQGKVYLHRSNAIIALGPESVTPTALPTAPIVAAGEPAMTPASTAELVAELSGEIQAILDAGHLRPGYLGSGNFDQRSKSSAGEYLIDYWHHPSDTLLALLQALPHLPAGQQAAVQSYLQNEFAAFPPYQYVHIGWRDGAAREAFDLPPEAETDRVNFPPTANWSSFFSGWHFPPHMFYALWKYAAEFGGATAIFDASKALLNAVPSDSYLAEWSQVHNAYIAGYLGYLELEKLAGYPESTAIRTELERLLQLRVATFEKDTPYTCDDYRRTLSVARNFMNLVPELGQYLHDHALTAVTEALQEYEYVAPNWFVTKTEQIFYEGVIQPLFDASALFQAKALILKESREELLQYLDVPAFQRGDLFYIQNLVATIEAAPHLEKSVSTHYGNHGETVTYTLGLVGSASTLALSDMLPAGVSAPFSFSLDGTGVQPVYDPVQHQLSWSDSPPVGQEVTIRYSVEIETTAYTLLTNLAQLRDQDDRTSSASTTLFVNSILIHLPLIYRAD